MKEIEKDLQAYRKKKQDAKTREIKTKEWSTRKNLLFEYITFPFVYASNIICSKILPDENEVAEPIENEEDTYSNELDKSKDVNLFYFSLIMYLMLCPFLDK